MAQTQENQAEKEARFLRKTRYVLAALCAAAVFVLDLSFRQVFVTLACLPAFVGIYFLIRACYRRRTH